MSRTKRKKIEDPISSSSSDDSSDESSGTSSDDDDDDEETKKCEEKPKITLSSQDLEDAINFLVTKKGKGKIENTEISSEQHDHQRKGGNGGGNSLSEIIPGYIAPMSLDSSSLDIYKKRNHKKTNLSSSSMEKSTKISSICTKPSDFASKNFKMSKTDPLVLSKKESNAGSGWFGFEATANTPSLQADIAIIRNRNYIDPKKFYKSSDMGKKGDYKMVQLGTVVEGSMESVYTNRLTKKQRKNNVLEEVMGEVFDSKDDYVKKKYTKMQREKTLAASKRAKVTRRRVKYTR